MTGHDAVQTKAVRAIQVRETEACREGVLGGVAPEDHIARPGVAAVGVSVFGPDEEVREPIAIDIPSIAHRATRVVIGCHAGQAKAVRAIEAREIEVRGEVPPARPVRLADGEEEGDGGERAPPAPLQLSPQPAGQAGQARHPRTAARAPGRPPRDPAWRLSAPAPLGRALRHEDPRGMKDWCREEWLRPAWDSLLGRGVFSRPLPRTRRSIARTPAFAQDSSVAAVPRFERARGLWPFMLLKLRAGAGAYSYMTWIGLCGKPA